MCWIIPASVSKSKYGRGLCSFWISSTKSTLHLFGWNSWIYTLPPTNMIWWTTHDNPLLSYGVDLPTTLSCFSLDKQANSVCFEIGTLHIYQIYSDI